MGRQLEHGHKGHRHGTPDQQAAQVGPEEGRGHSEEQGTQGSGQCPAGQQPARSPGIGQGPGGHLHGHVAVIIKGRKVSEGRGPDLEIGH